MLPYFLKSRQVIDACIESVSFKKDLEAITEVLVKAAHADQLIMICGNGGSSADADHFAAELICRYKHNRSALRALPLSHQGAVTTAISNDFGYEHVFARQVEGLGRKNDVLIAISTSGKSPNILKALAEARKNNVTTVALTGAYIQDVAPLSDYVLSVPSMDTPLIQQIHVMAYHYMCDAVEQSIMQRVGLQQVYSVS